MTLLVRCVELLIVSFSAPRSPLDWVVAFDHRDSLLVVLSTIHSPLPRSSPFRSHRHFHLVVVVVVDTDFLTPTSFKIIPIDLQRPLYPAALFEPPRSITGRYNFFVIRFVRCPHTANRSVITGSGLSALLPPISK